MGTLCKEVLRGCLAIFTVRGATTSPFPLTKLIIRHPTQYGPRQEEKIVPKQMNNKKRSFGMIFSR